MKEIERNELNRRTKKSDILNEGHGLELNMLTLSINECDLELYKQYRFL